MSLPFPIQRVLRQLKRSGIWQNSLEDVLDALATFLAVIIVTHTTDNRQQVLDCFINLLRDATQRAEQAEHELAETDGYDKAETTTRVPHMARPAADPAPND